MKECCQTQPATRHLSLSISFIAQAACIFGLLALSSCGGSSSSPTTPPNATDPGPIVTTDNYVIKSGETVSPKGPLTINASNSVTIAGHLVASGNNGQPITINSQGDVVISGTLAAGNGNFVAPSAGTVRSTAGASTVVAAVDGGILTIVSMTGKITISGSIAAGDGAAPPTATNANGSILPTDANGGKGSHGGNVILHAPNGSINVPTGGTIHLGNGGNGADTQISGQDLLTFSGTPSNNGGNSGALLLDSPSITGLTTASAQLPFDFPPQNPIFTAGSTVLFPTSANVTGGTGGNGGAFRFGIDAAGNPTWPSATSANGFASSAGRLTSYAPTTVTQTGADGGFGWLNGGIGAVSNVSGQNGTIPGANGQNAIAIGGSGGWGYVPGDGGNANAYGGRGAAGDNFTLRGGDGGTATATGGAAGGLISGRAGQAFARGGSGGHGGGDCTLGSVATGGAGGTGAAATATGNPGEAHGGNGGDGGSGFTHDGAGGSFGGATAVNLFGGAPIQVSGQPGKNGSVCVPVLVSLAITPANATVKVGFLVSYTAIGTFLNGIKKDLTSQLTWTTSSGGSIASIDVDGIATGVNPGTDAVVGTSTYTDSKGVLIKGTVPITVVAPSSVGLRKLGGGMQSSCASNTQGEIYFAGNNSFGQGGPNIPLTDNIKSFTWGSITFPPPVGGHSATAAATIPSVLSIGAFANAAIIPNGSGGTTHPEAGQLYTWGSNFYGNLGDGTTTDSATPIPVAGMTNAIATAAGNGKTVVVLADGTVWDWGGYSTYIVLGNGTAGPSSTPVQVTGLTNVKDVATAEYFGFHSLALMNDGTVWAWGPNTFGQIGDGTTTDRSTPVQVGGLTSVTALAASNSASFALKSDGTVWTWGQTSVDSFDTAVTSPTPVQVAGLSNVIAISAGRSHAMALEGDGTVWTWAIDFDGNNFGQLGVGTSTTTTSSYTPTQVTSLSGVTDIGAGGYHSLARTSDGSVWTWGRNQSGQLGDGTTVDKNTPVQVPGFNLQ